MNKQSILNKKYKNMKKSNIKYSVLYNFLNKIFIKSIKYSVLHFFKKSINTLGVF